MTVLKGEAGCLGSPPLHRAVQQTRFNFSRLSVPISRLSPNVNIRGYGLHSSLAVHTAMNRSTTESIG
jgi:hypothetical protein